MTTDALLQDARFAVRQMARNRSFTTLALIAIGLGIGANTTVVSFFTALHLTTLSAPEAERLITIHRLDSRATGERHNLSAPEVQHLREHATTLSGLVAQQSEWMWLSHGERSVEVEGGRVSADYFDVVGIAPYAGGFFSAASDGSSVVFSHRLWTRTFDGDPAVVGRTLRLNRQTFTIVGIAPQEFGGLYLGDFVSYQVSRRTREIGIRMALGAQTGHVKAWIVRKVLVATGIGLSIGAMIALQAAPLLTAFLYDVAPADASTFAAAICLLASVSVVASLVPARAVSRIDPAAVLRAQ